MLEIPTRFVYIHMIDTARAAVGSRDGHKQTSNKLSSMGDSRSLGRHGSVNIARSESPIVDRGSLFTAQVCWPVRSTAAAHAAIALMRSEGPAAGADHNMTAFRVREGGKKWVKAYDDDGEAHGGQRLLGGLTRLKGTDIAVMVSRVYGGENLGKVRFEHIVRCAEALLASLGHQPDKGIVHSWGSGQSLGGGEASSSSAAVEAVPSTSSPGSSTAAAADKKPASARKRPRPEQAAAAAAAEAAERRRLMAEAAERRAQLLQGSAEKAIEL